MLSFTKFPIFFSSLLLLFLTQSITALPTGHKATLDDVNPTSLNSTILLKPRASISVVADILDIATTVVDDIVALIGDIIDAEQDFESSFTQHMVDALHAAAPTANVMVCHDCSFRLDLGAYFTHYELDISGGLNWFTRGYDIAVFDYGTIVNQGDGGYINWCMYGAFENVGGVLTFTQIADDGY